MRGSTPGPVDEADSARKVSPWWKLSWPGLILTCILRTLKEFNTVSYVPSHLTYQDKLFLSNQTVTNKHQWAWTKLVWETAWHLLLPLGSDVNYA